MARHVGVGAPAPDFTLDGAFALSDLRGRPVVLAFVDTLAEVTTDAVRAELRGLGAVLVACADTGVWSFRPDDEAELRGPAAPAAARAYRVGHASALFVIDAGGTVRFAHVGAARVADALAAAGRALAAARRGVIHVTRREWIVASLVAGCAVALLGRTARAAGTAAPAGVSGDLDIQLDVNGQARTVRIDPRVTLLDALRERLGLTGTKKGCDQGQCGACTVLVDGRRVNSCLVLAIMAQGAKITTIEGLAKGDALHPVQAAFIAEDAYQCGYCTPGQIMSAVALLAEGRARTDAEVREHMSGNLCRCGAYPNIVAAVQRARKEV